MADLAWSAWQLVSSLPWRLVSGGLLAWCTLSFVLAVVLGRMIREADKAAGVLVGAEDAALVRRNNEERLRGDFMSAWTAEPEEQDEGQARRPTRSGPFLVREALQQDHARSLRSKSKQG